MDIKEISEIIEHIYGENECLVDIHLNFIDITFNNGSRKRVYQSELIKYIEKSLKRIYEPIDINIKIAHNGEISVSADVEVEKYNRSNSIFEGFLHMYKRLVINKG